MKLTLIIDANNLAHELYGIPDGSYEHIYDSMLINHLHEYTQHYLEDLEIVFCFDPCEKDLREYPGLSVQIADYGEKADDLIIDQVRYQLHQEVNNCLVITKDGPLSVRVREEGVRVLKIDDFIGIKDSEEPRFISPDLLPGFIRQRDLYKDYQDYLDIEDHFLTSEANSMFDGLSDEELLSEATLAKLPSRQMKHKEGSEKPQYQLCFKNWPRDETLYFFLSSCCEQHRKDFEILIDNISQDDYPQLAELLIETCGDEPNFLARPDNLKDSDN